MFCNREIEFDIIFSELQSLYVDFGLVASFADSGLSQTSIPVL